MDAAGVWDRFPATCQLDGKRRDRIIVAVCRVVLSEEVCWNLCNTKGPAGQWPCSDICSPTRAMQRERVTAIVEHRGRGIELRSDRESKLPMRSNSLTLLT